MKSNFHPGELLVCQRSHFAFTGNNICSILIDELLVIVIVNQITVKALRLGTGDIVFIMPFDLLDFTYKRYAI
jgi:hypothetical protein